jgi:hypothetical protein
VIARQIGSIKSGAATGAGRPPEAAEGGVQAALCGKQRQGRWFESTIRWTVTSICAGGKGEMLCFTSGSCA